MLNKHLLVKTFPIAEKENVILFKDYRITMLFDRLFRIEKNEKGEFCDLATQSVWYRNMPKVNHSVKEGDDFVEVKTDAATLHLETDFEKSYVLLGKKKLAITNDGNLLGTTRTLDQYNGECHIRKFTRLELGTGVCSKSGLAVVDDTESLRLNDNGQLLEKSSDEFDIYVNSPFSRSSPRL